MASGGVALDALAEDVGVTGGEAKVMEAGFEIRGRVDELVAGPKGALWELEDAAIAGFLQDHHLLLRAGRAVILGAVVAAGRI